MNIADRVNPPVNVVISNVPGPRQPLFMGGAMLERYFPLSTIAEGMASTSRSTATWIHSTSVWSHAETSFPISIFY